MRSDSGFRSAISFRIALCLAIVVGLTLFLPPLPAPRYLSMLVGETLPRMRQPAGAAALRAGITNREWSREWVPLTRAEVPNPAAPLAKPPPAAPSGPSPKGTAQNAGVLKAAAAARAAIERDQATNSFYPAQKAVALSAAGDRPGAAKALHAAASRTFLTVPDRYLAPKPAEAEGGRTEDLIPESPDPLPAALAERRRVAAPSVIEPLVSGLLAMALHGGLDVRLDVLKVGRLIREGLPTLDGARSGATLESQVVALNPVLGPALEAARRKTDAAEVDREMTRAVTWRAKIESFGAQSPISEESLLRIGLQWFHLAGIWISLLIVLILGVAAYVIGIPAARRLSSAPLPLAVALILAGLFYFLSPETHFSAPVAVQALAAAPIRSAALMEQVWSAPLCIATAALMAAFLPFTGAPGKPGIYARFMALLRDTAFFGLSFLMILFLIVSIRLHAAENHAAQQILDAVHVGEAKVLRLERSRL